ncbi:MAG: hypothetical protein ABIJ41_07260 [Candidatus Omnitrophota bacterium]
MKKQGKLRNKEGFILITTYIFLTVLISMTAGFALSSVNELNHARRYRDSAKAFWLAEAGVQRFIEDTTLLDGSNIGYFSVGNYSVSLAKADDMTVRTVTSSSIVNGIRKQVQIDFPVVPLSIFDNTMSTAGNIDLDGNLGVMNVHGKARCSGVYDDLGKNLTGNFDDLVEDVSSEETILTYPDLNDSLDQDLVDRGVGTSAPNEFVDFVQFNRNLISQYPEGEVAYFLGNGTLTITPNADFSGKKIIFVEGDSPGGGDVNIVFDATWQDNQNITIISTGSVNYIQPLQIGVEDSKLNVIAWSDYYEPAALVSAHDGLTFSHSYAYLRDVLDISSTHGSLIGNDRIYVKETLAWKEFNYDESILEELPPGFEGLIMGSGEGQQTVEYQTTPTAWREI